MLSGLSLGGNINFSHNYHSKFLSLSVSLVGIIILHLDLLFGYSAYTIYFKTYNQISTGNVLSLVEPQMKRKQILIEKISVI